MDNSIPSSQIKKERERVARLYISFCKIHYGSNVAIIKLESGGKTTVEVSEENIKACMVKYIETAGISEFGIDGACNRVKTLYANMQNKDSSKLSPLGIEVMSEMVLAAVTDAIENNGTNVMEVNSYAHAAS
ncbi:hypothetical protein [Dickeya sp. ws52]|uniref:hypothetical protein n=1 Tax=Dickeya sp. ws52 TaxID=2576377 RepID=UPI001180D8F5|nr:hypothetical protein [Dickeya sp. ws52]TYL43927.1 hypothetical protein FDP13_03740 [Dickeya sp. ws52]